jgi:hypothetical protein
MVSEALKFLKVSQSFCHIRHIFSIQILPLPRWDSSEVSDTNCTPALVKVRPSRWRGLWTSNPVTIEPEDSGRQWRKDCLLILLSMPQSGCGHNQKT